MRESERIAFQVAPRTIAHRNLDPVEFARREGNDDGSWRDMKYSK